MLAIFINMFVLMLGMQSVLSYAAQPCKIELARIVSIEGTIEIRRAVNNQNNIWTPIGMNDAVCLGDIIRSRTNSRAGLRLANNSMMRLDQRSSMTFLLEEDKNKSFLMNLLEGAIHIITRTPKPFDVKTPFINASVHGTEFLVRATPENGQVVVYEGKVTASNDYGNVVLNDREAATAQPYQAPQKSINVHPTDAVRWALHYPTITSYWQFDPSDTGQMIQKASDLLAVGQADDAQSIITKLIQKQPDNSDAHALFAIIAVVQGDKEAARSYANQAVQFNVQSPVAYLALSYAQQAQFEVEAALASVHKALELNARSALTWVRLAELQMSTGETDRAISSAQEAVRLQPNLAQTQSVMGFAHLLQIDIDSAKEAFNQSIVLDSSDPMPRLGLGLTLIRQGQLEEGRIQLEIAASLDPANSLIRSYLGKAYFEERRYPLAGTQFDLAKGRDPKDPTPWLYDAIQKQTQNRPIEALQDIQKSIELNGNRAVYRSKFLLDRDEAARGSSLARIFETLGFERRAIMETAKSLSYDPANHSAHRFLSDTYANTPRHEIARVSELLQAQLLQPINVNPVQPHMAVADLNIITGTTPSAVNFNEFSPLMERNKPQIVTSGIVGSNGTLGNEVVASMQRDRASVSLGQFHYETNGFRPNNDQNHNVYNGFFQYALTPKLNVQAEVRRRETEHGDLVLRFSDNANKKNEFAENRYDYHRKLIENTARFGARYAFSPNQDFLFSAKYIDRDVNITGSSPSHSDRSGYHIEGQHLYRHEIFNTTIGGGGYQFSEKATLPLKEISRKNIYVYTNINLRPNLTTTLGIEL
jgi:tetratricopeptide (TPR) repeat protein